MMEHYYEARDLFCVLCKDRVALKEIEFEEHMNKVHTITTHLDTLYSVNFTTKMFKVSIVSRVKKFLTAHKKKEDFTCIFCNNIVNDCYFCFTKLEEFQLHLTETHEIFYEFDLILAMHSMESMKEFEQMLVFKERPVKCLICAKIIKSYAMLEHMQDHRDVMSLENLPPKEELEPVIDMVLVEEPQKCLNCYHCFRNTRMLELHKTIHEENVEAGDAEPTSNDTKPVVLCECCDVSKVKKNMKENLQDPLYMRGEQQLTYGSTQSLNELKRLLRPCPNCAKFTLKKEKMAHYKAEHLEYYRLLLHHNNTAWKLGPWSQLSPCDICSKSIMQCNMKIHKLHKHSVDINNTLVKFKVDPESICNICGHVSKYAKDLKKHKKFVHDKILEYLCDFCKKKFSNKGNLNQHQIKHTGVTPFNCNMCDRKFRRKDKLEKHLLSHKPLVLLSTKKPQQFVMSTENGVYELRKKFLRPCKDCDKFILKKEKLDHYKKWHIEYYKQLLDHNNQVWRSSPSSQYQPCDMCKKSIRKCNIKEHKLHMHSVDMMNTLVKIEKGPDSICNMCDHVSKYAKDLKKHKKTVHEKIRNHTCLICKKQFSNQGNLNQHKVIHTLDTPFQCNMCGQQFKWRSQLKTHITTHGSMDLLDRTMPKTEEGDEKDKIRLVERRTDEKNGSSYLYILRAKVV